MTKGRLFETPEVVTRLGETLFVKCPLYPAKAPFCPIYINKELFNQYIAQNETSWEDMSTIISDLFGITLDVTASLGEQIGWAFVDKQADPLSLSLAGNQGSGRAYYTGTHFNIKGEKTPLATSSEIIHSNGVLSMKDGIWNSLIGNSLYPNCKISPVLAILDLKEVYIHPETKQEIRKVKIIRLDIDGSLDRITHLFYLNKPLAKENLLAMARGFGELDAYKFMQRIVHGSWSNGNISPSGHLIDYDSVCAVKGRQPQFSATSYYIDNYFSFEYVGKLKVLESLVNAPQINKDHVSLAAINEALVSARNKEIVTQFINLIGLVESKIPPNYLNRIYSLCEQFKTLSRYVRYNKERSFFTNIPLHFFAHLFDFSNFFRYYSLLKMDNQFNLDAGFALLVQSELIPDDEEIDIYGNYHEEPLESRVLTYLNDCFVSNEEEISILKIDAYNFVKKFDEIIEELVAKDHVSLLSMAVHSYVVNEDRFYLFPVFDLSGIIARLSLVKPAHEINDLIESIISVSRRDYNSYPVGNYQSDARIFVEGISYVELNTQGTFHIIFKLKKQNLNLDTSNYTISYNGSVYNTSISKIGSDYILIQSTVIDIRELIVPHPRDEVFKLRKYELLSNGNIVALHDYFGIDPKLHYYL